MRRVAEGVYERNGSYLVPIYHPPVNGGKQRRVWHSERCGVGCTHTLIADFKTARQAKRELEESKRQGRGGPQETVASWAARWLSVFPRAAETTNLHNSERVRAFVREHGSKLLSEVSVEDAQVWATTRAASVKEVRAMFSDAKRIKVIAANPFAELRMPSSRGRSDIQTLSIEELDALLEIARAVHGDYGPQFAAMLQLAAWTGARPGELFLFTMDQDPQEVAGDPDGHKLNVVDVKAREVRIEWQMNSKTGKVTRPKYDSQRPVVLLPQAEAALAGVEWPASGPMFLTKRLKPYTQRTHHYYWDPVRKAFAASLPATHWLRVRMAEDPENGDLDFYELRHRFGTALAQPPEGVRPASPYEIAEQMGHKDGGQLAMRRYLHVDKEIARRSLSDAWRSGGSAREDVG
jgi:integrase